MSRRIALPDSISLGIELEFLVAQHQTEEVKAADEDKRWTGLPPPTYQLRDEIRSHPANFNDASCRLKICETVAARGIPTGCYYPIDHDPLNPIAKSAGKEDVIAGGHQHVRVWNKQYASAKGGESQSRFDYWFVVRDGQIVSDMTVRPLYTLPRGYHWMPMELNSPIMMGLSGLDQGMSQLREIIQGLREHMKIWINSRCGLHIHVGNGVGELDLNIAKRVVSLVYILEQPLLFNLCHSVRKTSAYAAMITTDSWLAREPWTPDRVLDCEGLLHVKQLQVLRELCLHRAKDIDSPINAIHRIWAQPSINALRSLLRRPIFDQASSSRCALNISEFNTIEFRYPEATFDAEFIYRWIMVVRHIFAISMRSPEDFGFILYRMYELTTRDDLPRWPALLAAMNFYIHPDLWQERMRSYRQELHDLDAVPIVPVVEPPLPREPFWLL